MSYWFFLSYTGLGDDPYFKRFYRELAETVALKVGAASDKDVGFLDNESIQVGAEWPADLVRALQTSQIFVPVYTPRFFTSEYCGKEWAVFRQRQTDHLETARTEATVRGETPPGRAPVILPVLWVSQKDLPKPLPEVVADLQFDHAAFGKVYSEEGLRLLFRLDRHRDARVEFVDRFADALIQAGRTHRLPPLPATPTLKTVDSAFQARPAEELPKLPASAGGPSYVQFVFVAGRREELQPLRASLDFYGDSGNEWKPYHPEVQEAVGLTAMNVAFTERLQYEVVPLDPTLIQRLRQAEAANKVVMIVVDTWTLRLDRYRSFMQQYDAGQFLNCVVLIPWNNRDDETVSSRGALERAVGEAFTRRVVAKDPNYFVDTIDSPQTLVQVLSDAVNIARGRILKVAEVKRPLAGDVIMAKPTL
jgi:FxsC-like protein